MLISTQVYLEWLLCCSYNFPKGIFPLGNTGVIFMNVELPGNKEVKNSIVVSKLAQIEEGSIHENNELYK
jgi:hypothetical protein